MIHNIWQYLRGGRAAAVIYSLVESCKLASVDPIECPADVLGRVATYSPDSIGELVPAAWSTAAAKSLAVETAAV